jgi:hypothetical protein
MTALLLTGLQPAIVVGAHHYVRSAAIGSNTGTDWNNAWTNTSAIMWGRIAAGDSVWIAGGNYTTLAPSVSGATNAAIYIARVRTTNTTPAAAAGWNSSYDSLVTIASLSPVTINSVDWITLDGQIPHSGILITNTAATNDSLSRYAVNISGGADYFTLKNTKIRLCNRAYNVGSSTYDRRCVNVSYSKANIAYGMYIGYNDLAHGDTLFSILYQTAMTVEHNWFHDNNREAVIGPHQNIWQSIGNTNITFRYNLITNYQQECIMMCFVSSSDAPNDTWYIYGNLFANGTEYSRVLESQYRAQYRIYFFNNTIANTGFLAIRGSGTANGGTWDPSCVSSNNVLFNSGASSGVGFGVGGDNYNITDGTTSGANSISGAVSSMFVNNNGRDYHIGSVVSAAHPKDKGVALAAIAGHTLNVDMDGNTRGADGVWDIGAYEYSSSTNLPPPDTAAPQVELTSPASGATVGGTLNLNATASDNEGGSGVASVVFLMDGNVVGTATI